MPTAFDLGQYTTNYNPVSGSPFVSIQDVMSSFGDVFQEIVQLLPQLLTLIEQAPTEIIQLIETGLQTFLNLIFPSDGSESPLLTALTSVLSSVLGGSGSSGLVTQIIDMIISLVPQLITSLTGLLGTSGGSGILSQLVGMLIQLLPNLLTSITGLIGSGSGSGVLSQLITMAESILTSPASLLSGFTGGSSILSQLTGALGGSGSGIGDLVTAIEGVGGDISSVISELTGSGGLLSGFTGGSSILAQLPSLLTLPLSSLGSGILPGGISLGSLTQIPGLSGLLGGLDTSGSTPLLSQLGSLLTLPLSAITGLVGSGGLLSGFTGGSSILSQLTSATSGSGGLLATFANLFNVNNISGLLDSNSGNIFPNLLNVQNLLSSLSIGNLTSNQTNLFSQPLFTSATTISPNSVYTWDGTVTATGATTPGAATVSANNITNTLLSNIVNVVPGDQITANIYTMWSGLSYTGSSPIQLVARVFDANKNLIASPMLASVVTPGASGAWQNISGTYTVPASAAYMCMGICLMGTAASGQVWFGNGLWSKVNSIPGGKVLGLSGLGSTITGDVQSFVDTLVNAFGGSGTSNPISALLAVLPNIPLIGSLIAALGGGGTGLSGLASAITSLPQQIIDLGLGGLTGTTSSGGTASSFGTELLNIPEGIIQGILNLGGRTVSTSQIQNAVTAQTDSVSGQAAQIAQIQAALGSGNSDSDAFERTSIGANWGIITSNSNISISLDGHNVNFSGSGGSGDLIAIKNDIVAATDNMQTGVILNSAAGSVPPFIPTSYGWNDLWLRMTAFTTWATVTGWRWRIREDGFWQLDYWLNGTIVIANAITGTAPQGPVSSTALNFLAGVQGNSRHYQATVNGTGVMDFIETGTVSQIGSSYRHRGFGGRCEQLLLANEAPGSLRQWTAQG